MWMNSMSTNPSNYALVRRFLWISQYLRSRNVVINLTLGILVFKPMIVTPRCICENVYMIMRLLYVINGDHLICDIYGLLALALQDQGNGSHHDCI